MTKEKLFPQRNEFPIRLVGGQAILDNGDFNSLLKIYGKLFKRLRQEVKHTGNISRYICYRSEIENNRSLHCLFIEVKKIGNIPSSMTAWELDRSSRIIWLPGANKDVQASRDAINWQWIKPSSSDQHRFIGEFSAPLPFNLTFPGCLPEYEMMLAGNAYINLLDNLPPNDEIEIADYCQAWPEMYGKMAEWLRDKLPRHIISRIEHYGSTSIPAMPAKPIIDILIEIPSFPDAKQKILPLLDREDWEYWWHDEHMVFIKRDGLEGKRTHHVHLAPAGHKIWQGLAFRDYLKSHHEDAAGYAELKRSLAGRYCRDRERYTEAKTEFIMNITAKAQEYL